MKKNVVLFTAVISILACDKIDNPIPTDLGTQALCNSEFPELVSSAPKRVLLEDYTGHTCGNCPGAALTAKQLEKDYPGRVFALAVHAGSFADPLPPQAKKFLSDFRTPASQQWDDFFEISVNGNPNGMVNRKGEDAVWYKFPGEWFSEVQASLGQQADLELNLAASLSDSICATAFIQPLRILGNDLSISIVLMEDSVVDWQKNYENGGDPNYPYGDVENYVHNHVLRKNFNGIFGSALQLQEVGTDSIVPVGYKIAIDSTWNTENLSVLGFVFRTDTKEVLQVNKAKVSRD
ncbi:MAG: Omp28-related outer membrane protein [Luteibaculum sp.]